MRLMHVHRMCLGVCADVRKAANRINFNQPEEEFLDGDEAVGLGTLGARGEGGRLRVAARNQKQKMTAATAKKYAKQGYGTATNPLGGRGPVSGLSSTLAFTPVQVRAPLHVSRWVCASVLALTGWGLAVPRRPQ